MVRIHLLGAVLAALLIPRGSAAQSEAYVTVSLSTTQVYDTNVFAAPSSAGEQRDLSSRLGPLFETGYTSLPLRFVARYGLEAERYLNVVELNRNIARQDALFELRYLPFERLEFGLEGSFVTTQTPTELNLISNVVVGRNPANRETAASSITYHTTQRTQIVSDYEFRRDSVLTEADLTQTSGVRLDWHANTRTVYRAGYRFRRVSFGASDVEILPRDFHWITAGWTHSFAPGTTVEINAGPQISDGSVSPEIAAQLRRAVSRGEVSAYFSRTETTVLGERGLYDVYNAVVAGRYRPVHHLMLVASPSYSHSSRDDSRFSVYALDLSAITDISPRVSLITTGRLGRQDAVFGIAAHTIPFNEVSMKLTVSTSRKTFFDPMKAPGDQGVNAPAPVSDEAVKPKPKK